MSHSIMASSLAPQTKKHRYGGEEDHGQETVAKNAGRQVEAHARLRHQMKDGVDGEPAKGGDTVNVAKMNLAGEQQRQSKEEAKQKRTGQVGIRQRGRIQSAKRIDARNRLSVSVSHSSSPSLYLGFNVAKINSQFYTLQHAVSHPAKILPSSSGGSSANPPVPNAEIHDLAGWLPYA